MDKSTHQEPPSKKLAVVQSNDFIVNASNNMSLNQLKILYFLISCIKREDEFFLPIQVDYKTLMAVIGDDPGVRGRHSYLAKLLTGMQSGSYFIHTDTRTTMFNLFGVIDFDNDFENGDAIFKLNDDLSRYLLQQQKNFTVYPFSGIRSMASTYSIKLYDLLHAFVYIGYADFELDQLRRSLNLLNTETGIDRYKSYKDLSKEILKPAVNEINVRTDISLSFSPIKGETDKRRTVGVHFDIHGISSPAPLSMPPVSISLTGEEYNGRPLRKVSLL